MEGAALLSAQAAARMGVGYVCVASPSKDLFLKMPPDFLRIDWAHILTMDLSPFSAVAIGPGLGMGSQTLQLLLRFKAENLKNVLVDADALTVAAKHKIWPLPESWVLTPHAGELSRILPLTAAQIEADRLKAVADASQVTGAQVLLKGFRSVLRSGQKSYLINSGNVALAKAGTGDVLTGFISSLMAQGLPSAQAAVLGAYLHGRIADRWVGRGHSSRTLLASDLPNLLPKLMNQVLREIK
jgi:ADP-dependent NAD(P)H-hydrate dehydratase